MVPALKPHNLSDDPRCDVKLVEALKPFSLDQSAVCDAETLEDIIKWKDGCEGGFRYVFGKLWEGYEGDPTTVSETIKTIKGGGGQDMELYVTRKKGIVGTQPCVLYFHGGGFSFLDLTDVCFKSYTKSLAAAGVTVVAVNYRNMPFPGGLDDCISALKWVSENKGSLGVSKTILLGESAGGNLVFSVQIKARELGILDLVDGVYSVDPFIVNSYGPNNPDKALFPSLIDNNGYLFDNRGLDSLVKLYNSEAKLDPKNPLLAPYWADEAILKDLKPCVICVHELDIIRDEGLMMYQKLQKAGVPSTAWVVAGLPHSAEIYLMPPVAGHQPKLAASVANFAYSIAGGDASGSSGCTCM